MNELYIENNRDKLLRVVPGMPGIGDIPGIYLTMLQAVLYLVIFSPGVAVTKLCNGRCIF